MVVQINDFWLKTHEKCTFLVFPAVILQHHLNIYEIQNKERN